MTRYLCSLALLLNAATAEARACSGSAPAWVVGFDGPKARLTLDGVTTQMDVMLETRAEAREWPQALTLIGDRDTAILLIDRATCGPADNGQPFTAYLLTQRGQTPILLMGCCRDQP